MIQLSGVTLGKLSSMWPSDSIEGVIIQRMHEDKMTYYYHSIEELLFEIKLRKNIIASSKAMDKGHAQFTIFAYARCNPQYWLLTRKRGFLLKNDVKPSDAIRDIFENSSRYAFECATAMVIIYYHAILNSINEYLFNQLFRNIYLYSWHFDSDLGIQSIRTKHFLPGDVVYFNNPDFDPKTPWWRGENTVVLGDGTFFGHGFGIRTAQNMIEILNKKRKPESKPSAYLMDVAVRPAFKHLAIFSNKSPQRFPVNKFQHVVIHHNKSSISFDRYLIMLNRVYNKM